MLTLLHHYNNEIFFDSGKSIFTGFDGFGRGYKTKNYNPIDLNILLKIGYFLY